MLVIPLPDFTDLLAVVTIGFGLTYIVGHLKAVFHVLKDSPNYVDNPYNKAPDVKELFKKKH